MFTTGPRAAARCALRRLRHARGWWLAGLLTLLLPLHAAAQANFKPLERGDYQETDENLVMVRGLEVSGQYALRVMQNSSAELSGNEKQTQAHQDFRLHLRSVFHRDVSLNVVLEVAPGDLNQAGLRERSGDTRGALAQSPALTLNPREAYLRYLFNPNSPFLIGKHELSLGDRRGKTFDAIVGGATFDCRAGTWCMPLGFFKIGDAAADWVYHWALTYRGWDIAHDGGRDAFEVEIFRVIYTEHNVPLGANLGPATFDPATAQTSPVAGQVTDTLNQPIYYDAKEYNYFGLRVDWQQGAIFANLDITASQGRREYHLYRPADGGIPGGPIYSSGEGQRRASRNIAGTAVEVEAGYRWPALLAGVRLMSATGDAAVPEIDGKSYLRPLSGYHEITPGTYRGARLFFNGGDSNIGDGAGLGHSVNNTTLAGVFFQWTDREQGKFRYDGGLYLLSRNEAVLNELDKPQTEIGVELDNMLTWTFHKALRAEFELNLIAAGKAFSVNDVTRPAAEPENYVQGLGRLVYQF
ncbi:MAG: hypothetical protein HY342_11300 [Candidatus Lambdaproteobacteria bacterium]|nr:hypothetical protein [Candidatus Lambdaproteobacteria bacterium]